MTPVGALIEEVERRERQRRSAVAKARWTPERRERARKMARAAYYEWTERERDRRLPFQLRLMRDRAEIDCLSCGRPYQHIDDRRREPDWVFYCPLFDDWFGIGVWGWRWKKRSIQ